MIEISRRISAIAPSMTLAISARANELKAAGEKVINFGVGEPDCPTPAHVVDAAKSALDCGYTKYVAAAGLPALKKAIADKLLKENGLSYNPSQIVISNGAKHSVFNALFAILNGGDEVLIPSPYWLTYPEAVKSCGGVPVAVTGDYKNGCKVSAEQLEQAITPKTKAIIFNTPCNPTGAVYDEAEIRGIAKVCQRHNLIIISDEIYEKFVFDGKKHLSIASVSQEIKERTIVINGLSKSYAMTGWRVGYLAAPEHVARAIASFQSHSTSNANTISQYASIAALNGGDSYLNKMVSTFAQRRALMINRLEQMRNSGLDYVKPDGAFYIMLLCSKLYGKSYNGKTINGSIDMAELLLENEKVAATAGVAFGDDGFIRLSYALNEREIEEGLARIAQFARQVK